MLTARPPKPLKYRDVEYGHVKVIILASNIQIIISYEADDSLTNATYLITTSIDIK
jgi:hypothetical protein